MQSAYERVGQYVQEYNAARDNNNIPRAIEVGRLAVRDASDELKKPGLIPFHKSYYEQVISGINAFLANPTELKKPGASIQSVSPSEDKIKSTDWFAAPIPNLGFKDIAGLKDVRDEFIVNVFAPMYPQYSDIYKKYRGDENGLQILLYGPPGTGKTHAIKCLAGEMGCKIAVVQVKDVMANLVGDGAKIIAEIFEQANAYDRCIIFFDEIDAIASSREGEDSRHTKEQLTTLLTNMDGFTSAAKPGQIRIVIAATNRPWALDSAVKRGGRFDTQIYVPLPDEEAREQLIRLALGKDERIKNRVDVPLAPDVTIDWLVSRTEGYAGADIKAICRQAVAHPLKREIKARTRGENIKDAVRREDFEDVFSRYINSITDDALLQYDAYRMNMEYGKEYLNLKCDQLIRAYFSNYMRKKTGNTDQYPEVRIEKYEERWFKLLVSSGYVDETFGKRYDLTFLKEISESWDAN